MSGGGYGSGGPGRDAGKELKSTCYGEDRQKQAMSGENGDKDVRE